MPNLPYLSELLSNLRAGGRAALLLPVRLEHLRVSAEQFGLLCLLELAISLLFDVLVMGWPGQVVWSSLPFIVCGFSLLLGFGWMSARLHGQRDWLLVLPVAWLSLQLALVLPTLLAMVLSGALSVEWWQGPIPAADYAEWLYYALLGWSVLAGMLLWIRTAQVDLRRSTALAAIAICAMTLYTIEANQHALWQVATTNQAQDERWRQATREQVLYAQPGLLESRLQQLQPQRPGVTDLYLLGFAGYGSEGVFRREVELAGRLFADRFDTSGRSLLLINHTETGTKEPFATRTSLQAALGQFGTVMDRDEDILFLYLTSHGSADHRLAVELWPYQFDDISPKDLRAMLDESGIRWRVIVISACYAGGFIPALRDDHTLVITAADAKQTSFGCSDDAPLTYFGDALLDRALRETRSFEAAFALARKTVAKREASMGFQPSNPQIDMGAAIRTKLQELEKPAVHAQTPAPLLSHDTHTRTTDLR